jgi:hypothetical protein
MRRIILFLILSFVMPYANAAWTLIFENEETDSRYYVDINSILKKQQNVRMLTLEDFRSPQLIKKKSFQLKYNSIKSFVEFDCTAKKMRILTYLVYKDQMAKGETVFDKSTPLGWSKVNENTMDESYLNIACNEAAIN